MNDEPSADDWQPLADQPISAPQPWTPPAYGPPPAADAQPPSVDEGSARPEPPTPPAAPAYTQAPVYTQRPIYAQRPTDPQPWATPGAAYPGAGYPSGGMDFVEGGRPKRHVLGLVLGVIVTVVVLAVVGGIVLLGTHSSNTANGASAAVSASAAPRASRQPALPTEPAPSNAPAPSKAPAPAASSGALDHYLLSPADLGSNTLMVLIPGGRSVGDQATLDFCGYHYTTEALRTTRVQVEYVGGAQDASNEFVQYKSGGASHAFGEIQKAVSGCPSTFTDKDGNQFSHVERATITGLTKEHLAITFEMAAPGLDGSLITQWSTVVYQFDGNYFSGVYVYGTDKTQVQQLGAKLAVKAAQHLAEAAAGKPGTGGGPFTSQAIPQDSGAPA
ncbi:MAG: hypothetical protein ACRDV3_10870 [Acidothermaceae bacterium]